MIEHGHATHRGLRREHNEDNYWADAERGLWLVADGMGGPGRGEVASVLVLNATVAAIAGGIGLADAFRRAGAAILDHPAQRESATPMGSTLAALKFDQAGNYELAWVGDSRIYLWQYGNLRRAPRPANVETDPGQASTATSPRSLATQTLGITPALQLDVDPIAGQCTPGTQFLLCSDGLTEEIDDARIESIVSRMDLAAQECVDQLILAALDAGGHDNITAVLVRVR